MILALTGAGISKASGIPTFEDQPGIRDSLSRSFANCHQAEYDRVIANMQAQVDRATPNDAHIALAEHDIPIITMNIDGLHQRAGSKHILPIHGTLPDIILYEDPAPLYDTARTWASLLLPGDFFLIVGTSFYTAIATQLKYIALGSGADIYEINDDAEQKVRDFLRQAETPSCSFEEFLKRSDIA